MTIMILLWKVNNIIIIVADNIQLYKVLFLEKGDTIKLNKASQTVNSSKNF